MQKTLTVEAIVTAFAAAGLVACGGAPAEPAQSPVGAKEVPAAAAAAPAPAAAADAAPAAPAGTDAAPAAPAAPATTAAADATPPKADDKPADAAKPMNMKKKAGGAKAGCGPGTCG